MKKQMQQENKPEALKGLCPYCLKGIEVHMDVKNRPYWRCWRCEIRSFGTQTALNKLFRTKWITPTHKPQGTSRKRK